MKLQGFKSIINEEFQRLGGITFSPETLKDQDPDTGPLMSRFKFKQVDGADRFYPVFRIPTWRVAKISWPALITYCSSVNRDNGEILLERCQIDRSFSHLYKISTSSGSSALKLTFEPFIIAAISSISIQ
jgi:hypothetical protein